MAALVLKDQGHEVHGLFMSNWEDDDDSYCTEAQDFQDARAVAQELGIPLHRASFAGEYRDRVFADFLSEYRAGRTPNPDVLCNREIKFGVALQYTRRLGASSFATGHYARVAGNGSDRALLKAVDASKDQTYFLHAVERTDLERVLMPIGEFHKDEVRDRARRSGLPVFDKPDSTGICFIGERPFREFLSRYVRDEPGPMVSAEGESLGTHRGLPFYTLGQRAGLHIGGRRGSTEQPWYVAGKDIERNTLVIVQGNDHPLLWSKALTTGPMHWLSDRVTTELRCTVKVRYRQPEQSALLVPREDGSADITFEQPQRSVTPGQYAVAYLGERCIGGAVITSIAKTIASEAVRLRI